MLLPPNEDFQVVGESTVGGGLWYKIDIPNLSGAETWVFSEDVESFGGCDDLGSAAPPPIQTASGGARAQPTNTPQPGATEAPVDQGDHGDTPVGETGINYTDNSGNRWTLPCGSPIPAGAVCTCNCVTVTQEPPRGGNSGGNSGGGTTTSHYWYPN
jgi:hypothetical protein